jgi:mannosyltransferase PIG-V
VSRLRQPLREAVVPFVVARVVVLGTLALARFVIDRTHPASAAAVARVHQGLLGWDAGWYKTIAEVGYAPLGKDSLRFFPALPLLTHVVAWLPGVSGGVALVGISNLAALAATMLLFALVRRETGDVEVARRALWILSLAPAAFVLVMGYAESTLLCLTLGCFLVLRPSADRPPTFAWVALLGFGAALTRPVGVVLVLAVAVELRRWWPRLSGRQRATGLVATVAPLLGVAAFLGWSDHVVGDPWAPLRVQLQSAHHGGLSDPFVTVCHDASGLFHHHVGTALHVPWVLLALALLVVCGRRLPAPYTVLAAATMALALAGSNLDSFERYALSAFPLTMAAALICRGRQVDRVLFALLPAALAGYALLAFLNISVP